MRPELRVSLHEPGLDPEQEPPGAAGNQETLSQDTQKKEVRGRKGGDSKPLIKPHAES